jgi:hypothetical protein
MDSQPADLSHSDEPTRSPAPLIVSLLINFAGEGGHPYPYNQSVGVAARSIGWEHRAAVQVTCPIKNLPPGWEVCLEPIRYHGARPQFLDILKCSRSLYRYLRKLTTVEHRPIILFLELFSFTHLAALAAALIGIPRKDVSLWLVYRYDIHRHRTRILYKLCHVFFHRLVHCRLVLFSDSALLAKALGAYFHQAFTVLPIPHTGLNDPMKLPVWAASPERDGKVIGWWPGRPAEEKGLAIMQSIAQLTGEDAQQLAIVVAHTAPLKSSANGCQIISIPTDLPRDEYLGWFRVTDVVLLPYDAAKYNERTSGIFIEAIVFGKPPLVTDGTWMADELRTANLPELIMDWADPNLPATIRRLAHDAEVQRKLNGLQKVYREHHTEQSYAHVMQRVFNAPQV